MPSDPAQRKRGAQQKAIIHATVVNCLVKRYIQNMVPFIAERIGLQS